MTTMQKVAWKISFSLSDFQLSWVIQMFLAASEIPLLGWIKIFLLFCLKCNSKRRSYTGERERGQQTSRCCFSSQLNLMFHQMLLLSTLHLWNLDLWGCQLEIRNPPQQDAVMFPHAILQYAGVCNGPLHFRNGEEAESLDVVEVRKARLLTPGRWVW